MQEIMQHTGRIKAIHSFGLNPKEEFLSIASRFASLPGTILLLSGGDQDSARFNILGVQPWLWLQTKDRNIKIKTDYVQQSFQDDPFTVLENLLTFYQTDVQDRNLPLQSGLMGYLAYDLQHRLEELPRTTMDDLNLPDMWLIAPSVLLVEDLRNRKFSLHITELENQGCWISEKDHFLDALQQSPPDLQAVRTVYQPASNFQPGQYKQSVEKIREYIRAGHVYQVNLSQRFSLEFQGHPFTLLQTMFRRNPASFFAYLHCTDHQILSTSPERFLLKKGSYVETRPIKGTRPRAADQNQDRANALELMHSPKDDAELSMIVDLLRNDLGKVCQAGSVQVQEHKRLEKYRNVFHLVSIIQGRLPEDRSCVDLLRAAFPGGSITGCPKVRAMEIIDELEPNPRHVYTGSLGYFSFAGDMDLSIAIRTGIASGHNMVFSVGGGIVADSDPQLEFEETLHKGQTLMQAFEQACASELQQSAYIWQNGQIIPEAQTRIPAWIPGLEYGFGLFETMYATQGQVRFLQEHIQRLTKSWRILWQTEPPNLSWSSIVAQVLEANALQYNQAGVKIMAVKGSRQNPLSDDQLLIRAWPYVHRLHRLQKPGLDLLTHPEPRQSCLADYKTLNYLYYHLAGHWAVQQGADEALVLNPDGSVSETNSANILCVLDDTLLIPDSAHVLPGVMQDKVLQVLQDMGYNLEQKKLEPRDLYECDCVLLTNALLGPVRALSLDQKPLGRSSSLVQKLQNHISHSRLF